MKFSNLLFTPIDLAVPKLEIKKINFTHLRPKPSPFWNYEQLLDNPSEFSGENVWRTDLDEVRNTLKSLVLQLPLKRLYNVRLSEQIDVVRPHVDVNKNGVPKEHFDEYEQSEPCGYRFVFHGSDSALNIHKGNQTVIARLPSVPSVYLLNSTSGVHSVTGDIGRITLYVRGIVDEQRHNELIERSLAKFGDFAIWK